MRNKISFTKIENELAPGFRNRMKGAEGAEDVQRIFAGFLRDMLSRLTGAEVVLDEGDVRVDPKAEDHFVLGPGIAQNPEFTNFLEHTDLMDILRRQAMDAANKIKRLGKHSERDETKLFPRKDRKL